MSRGQCARAIGIILVVAFFVGFTLAEDWRERRAWGQRNLDPRRGNVWLEPNHSRWKVCDGTTLVYWSEGRGGYSVATVPNGPECAP